MTPATSAPEVHVPDPAKRKLAIFIVLGCTLLVAIAMLRIDQALEFLLSRLSDESGPVAAVSVRDGRDGAAHALRQHPADLPVGLSAVHLFARLKPNEDVGEFADRAL